MEILAAWYNNRAHTKATVHAKGDVWILSAAAHPAKWAELLVWGQANTITPYQAPPVETPDEAAERFQDEQLLKAVVLAINDGTLVQGANRTPAQLKAIIKAKL